MGHKLGKYAELFDPQHEHFCQGCIKPEHFYGPFSDNLCSVCRGEQTATELGHRTLSEDEKKKLSQLTDETIIRCSKEKKKIAMAYSGGKDSTSLVIRLIERAKQLGVDINIACITVRVPTEPPAIEMNIKKFSSVAKERGLPVEFYDIAPEFDMYAFYKDLFLNEEYNRLLMSDFSIIRKSNIQEANQSTSLICGICSYMLESLVIKKALELGTDVIMNGLSPDEVGRYIGRISDEHLQQGLMPVNLRGKFSKKIEDSYYNSSWGKVLVLFPYHYWHYNEKEAREQSEAFIVKTHSLQTNCAIVFIGTILDLVTVKKVFYIDYFATLIRSGMMSKEDGSELAHMLYSAISNQQSPLWTELIDPTLQKFGMSFEDFIEARRGVLMKLADAPELAGQIPS